MHDQRRALFDLSGQVALVTGGAVHLGYDSACVLAAAGCSVAVTSRELERARASARRIADVYGVETLPLALDHTVPARVVEAVTSVARWKGRIDILVNNSGGGSGRGTCDFLERSTEDAAALISLNLTGVLTCCREAGKLMVPKRRGKIINIASMAGLVGRDRRMYQRSGLAGQPVDYAAAKAGVIGLTRDLAGYLSPMGVCVNAISPGGFNRDLPESFVRDYSDRVPLGRMGRDGIDLKGAVLFLASPASDYVTGHNLVVDGGFSIWH
jgi:NAD(P)-dependent dehydrogenase (short-subunit alcohol dehydrogenase family)